MKKYTFKDFLAGKVDVRCVNVEQKKAFLEVCAKHGLLWQSGTKADSWLPPGSIITMKGFNNGRLGESDTQFADHCVSFDKIDLSLAPRYQITIDCDGNTTTAKMLVNGKEVKTATAKRNPNDKANWRIGAQTAFDHLWQKQPKPEKPAGMAGFKVGDRVVIVGLPDSGCNKKHGRIVARAPFDNGWVGVELDEHVYDHDCDGMAKAGHGCWCSPFVLRHEQPTKQTVREVKRHAKAGEWVRIVNKIPCTDCRYENGDVLRVVREGSFMDDLSCGGAGVHSVEYVVLEGYQPGRDGK